MDHDRFPFDPVDDVPDPGAALYLFTILATELLLGRPPVTPFTPPASDHAAPEPPAAPEPTADEQSAERYQPGDRPQAGDRYQPRPDAEQRDLAQALLRVVSALAHLGATARSATARSAAARSATARSATARSPTAAPTTTLRPVPLPGPHTRRQPAGIDRQRRRWLTAAAVTVALGVALRPRRHRHVTERRPCAGCAH